MSYAARRPLPPPRPYGVRTAGPRPPIGGAVALGASTAVLGGALGAIGGTLGCLLCLAAIGAIGLFSCVVAITAYTKQFLNKYENYNGVGSGVGQLQIGFALLFVSLFYAIVCRMQRN